jgi:hypothetical protein
MARKTMIAASDFGSLTFGSEQHLADHPELHQMEYLSMNSMGPLLQGCPSALGHAAHQVVHVWKRQSQLVVVVALGTGQDPRHKHKTLDSLVRRFG